MEREIQPGEWWQIAGIGLGISVFTIGAILSPMNNIFALFGIAVVVTTFYARAVNRYLIDRHFPEYERSAAFLLLLWGLVEIAVLLAIVANSVVESLQSGIFLPEKLILAMLCLIVCLWLALPLRSG